MLYSTWPGHCPLYVQIKSSRCALLDRKANWFQSLLFSDVSAFFCVSVLKYILTSDAYLINKPFPCICNSYLIISAYMKIWSYLLLLCKTTYFMNIQQLRSNSEGDKIPLWNVLILCYLLDAIAELRDRFPVVSQWFDSLATQPSFIAGVQKVGLCISSADNRSSVCTVQSNTVTKTSQSFLNSRWNLRRNRPQPL